MLYVVLHSPAYVEGRDEADRGASNQPMTQVYSLLNLTFWWLIYCLHMQTYIYRYLEMLFHYREFL